MLCRVCLGAALVRRLWKYPGTLDDTPISAVWRNNRIKHVTLGNDGGAESSSDCNRQRRVRDKSKQSKDSPDQIRTWAGVQYTQSWLLADGQTMPFWNIFKQVEQFSHNMSTIMLKFKTHRHIPEPSRASHLSPRQHNHRDNAETRRNVGDNLSYRVQLPAFSLYNWMCQMRKELVVEAFFYRQESGGGGESHWERFQTEYYHVIGMISTIYE